MSPVSKTFVWVRDDASNGYLIDLVVLLYSMSGHSREYILLDPM